MKKPRTWNAQRELSEVDDIHPEKHSLRLVGRVGAYRSLSFRIVSYTGEKSVFPLGMADNMSG